MNEEQEYEPLVGITVAELTRLREELSDIEESYRNVMEEKCAPDEHHCACVPALRAEIIALQEIIQWAIKECEDGDRATTFSVEFRRRMEEKLPKYLVCNVCGKRHKGNNCDLGLVSALRNIVQWSDACWTGGYAGDPNLPHPAWEDVKEGRAMLRKLEYK